MAEENVLSSGIETLYTMKENLLELDGYKEKRIELEKAEEQLEKFISLKEKAISEEIQTITEKRVNEIEDSFEEQIDNTKARLKKVKGKKEKLKDAKISERIELETADLVKERKQFKEEIRSVFQVNHISRVFNNRIFYALYLPRSIFDILVLLASVLICFLILPVGIHQLFLPNHIIWLVIIYFIVILIFGGSYVFVLHSTKEKHQEAMKELRELRNKLASNEKKIKAIQKSIRKDKDESTYGLDKFTEEMKDLETEIENIIEEKKTALINFESTTKGMIADEIKSRHQSELNDLKKNYEDVYNELRIAEEKMKEFSLEISKKYEAFVGKEIMTVSQIDKLIELMESGTASKISEAMELNKQINHTKEQ